MKKIRFGVVGTNNITDWVIAGGRQDERFELTAVCSRTQERADEFAKKHGIPHTFTSLEEMAKSPVIDAVYIATPNYVHARQSILCMSHGKHVLCEKPFASNAREVRQMTEAAKKYGDQCVVISADIKRVDGIFTVFAKGGRENTGMEAIEWIKKCVSLGAGEVVVNSIDTDGVKKGFDIEMLERVCEAVNVPVIASGGAGCIDDFTDLFNKIPKISAGLAASIFHFGEVSIKDLKNELSMNNINVRI